MQSIGWLLQYLRAKTCIRGRGDEKAGETSHCTISPGLGMQVMCT